MISSIFSIGSVVLPILGAVPDGCIVLFSGLGPNAAEELAVGNNMYVYNSNVYINTYKHVKVGQNIDLCM